MTKFSDGQLAELRAPLKGDHVKDRAHAGRKLSYMEGWRIIDEANRIFGFDGWNRETIETRLVAEKARMIGRPPSEREGWGVSYISKVRVTVGDIIRDGIGAGHGIDADLGLAHESAIKEAETDAMKRALITFGNPFGLALYNKSQENVERGIPAPTMTERLMKAENTLNDAANRGPKAFEDAWNHIDIDLCPHLEAFAKKTFAELERQRKGSITITSGKEAARPEVVS